MPDRFNKAIVAGDACVDIHLKMADLLADLEVTPYRMVLGGTSASCAATLARLGTDTAFLGTVGKDFGGRFIIDELRKLDIDTGMTIIKEELNTISVLAFIDQDGERHLWGFPRVKQAFPDLDIDRIDPDRIRSASWLHSSGMTLLANGSIRRNLPEVYRIAYEAGVPTSLDLNTRVDDLSSLDPSAVDAIRKTLPYVRYLLGSAADEFYSFHPCEDWHDSIRYFADQDRTVIARMGKDGYIVISDGQERYSPSYDVEAINTTGAGDSFDAGFISAVLDGRDVFEAATFANAVSAYKISRESQDEDLSKEMIIDFMKTNRLRKCEE